MSIQPSEFIHRMVVVDAESQRGTNGIRVNYRLKMVDEDGEVVSDGRYRSYSARPSAGAHDPIPDSFEKVDNPDDPEVDKERISIEASCPECRRDATFMWVYGRDNDTETYPKGEPQCMECSYTYFDGCSSSLPQSLLKKVERRIEEEEASQELIDWADRDSRVNALY